MLYTKDLILRDMTEADLAAHLRWELEETEGQLWDGPWEYEGLTAAEREAQAYAYVEKLRSRMERTRALPPDARRTTFHIAAKDAPDRAVGWVNAYHIDDAYTYTAQPGRIAVGIDLPEPAARGKGWGTQALAAFAAYLLETEEEVFLQTWSGNGRMIHVAEKLGFEVCCRKEGLRLVRGQRYDGLTFRVTRKQFLTFSAGCATMSEQT